MRVPLRGVSRLSCHRATKSRQICIHNAPSDACKKEGVEKGRGGAGRPKKGRKGATATNCDLGGQPTSSPAFEIC